MLLERTYANNRILVTAGAGFIGSHLCKRLLAEGTDMICVDSYFTGSRRNITNLASNALFEATRQDVAFPLHLEVNAIFNLACPASPIHYRRGPVQTTKTSIHRAMIHKPLPQDGPRQRQPDLSKAKTQLTCSPKSRSTTA